MIFIKLGVLVCKICGVFEKRPVVANDVCDENECFIGNLRLTLLGTVIYG